MISGRTGCKLLPPGQHRGEPARLSSAQLSSLPRRVDQRPRFDEIVAQGALGACVANAASLACMQRMMAQGIGSWRPARLPLYRAALKIDGAWPADDGTFVETMVRVLSEQGMSDEASSPYSDTKKALRQESGAAYEAAASRCRLVSWKPLELDPDAFKFELLAGHPIVFAMALRESFDRVSDDGLVRVPRRGEAEVGGHAMRCVGYDEDGVVAANSWGRRWGSDGYCHLPWSMVTDPEHMRSAYSIQTLRCAA